MLKDTSAAQADVTFWPADGGFHNVPRLPAPVKFRMPNRTTKATMRWGTGGF